MMGFQTLKEAFRQEIETQTGGDIPARVYQYWKLRLLFEIAGNLDSLVVSYRELVKLTKERMAK